MKLNTAVGFPPPGQVGDLQFIVALPVGQRTLDDVPGLVGQVDRYAGQRL